MDDVVGLQKQQTLGELEEEWKERRAHLQTMNEALRVANSNHTFALNALNDTQKKIDALMTTLRANADHDTHWGSERRRGNRQ